MNKSRLFWWIVLALVFTIPISQFISARLLLVNCVFAFFITDSDGKYNVHLKRSWDLFLYIAIISVGIVYSKDVISGLRVLESNLSFLAIPIIFSRLADLDVKKLDMIFNSFVTGLLVACLICLINAGIAYGTYGDIRSFFFYSLTDIINYQPTYFAYYLIFAITYLLYRFYCMDLKINPIVNSLTVLFFFFMLLLTGGQTAFVSLLLIFSFFILKFFIEVKNNERKIVACLVVIMLSGMFLASLVDKGERGLSLNDAWDRLVLWESAINATPNLLIGVGTGDYKMALNEYYQAHNLQKFADENYNSHNQFIQLLLSSGFLGVISLILLLGRPLYLSAKNHNLLGILLIFPFLIYGMTEVFLGRYQGIVFFVMIHQLSMLQNRSGEFSKFVNPY